MIAVVSNKEMFNEQAARILTAMYGTGNTSPFELHCLCVSSMFCGITEKGN